METITAREFIENMFNLEFLTTSEVETIITAMELYAKGKCKEQREICSRQISGFPNILFTESEMEDNVLNAPEPLLELLK
jgi:hypothetical protein